MTEEEVARFIVASFDGVFELVASESNGAPQVAWGDRFYYFDPDGDEASRKMPFATIVTQDYEGFDTVSDLNRPGVFRLNIGLKRATFDILFDDLGETLDYTVFDRLMPHPAYGAQGWVCIVNPSVDGLDRVRPLLAEAHGRAAGRYARRHDGSGWAEGADDGDEA